MSERNYWMLVSSKDNFDVSKREGFKLAGMKSRHRKKAERVRPGDRVVFYLTGVQKFGGIATATSEYFEDHSPLWSSKKKGEEYPFRFQIKPDIILEEEQFIPAINMARHMQYTKKWPAEHWRLAFQGNVHSLPEEDFQLLEAEMKAASAAKVPASSGSSF